MSDWPYWYEIAIIAGLSAIGNIVMGHWEERTPIWRRLGKLVGLGVLAVTVSATLGRGWFHGLLGLLGVLVLVIHGWWLPRHGVNGWTGEPREKYYALRGWPWPPGRR